MRADHYIEYRLLPDPEISLHHLMNALFAKLHRALVEHRSADIGLSFPAAKVGKAGLGDRLRLFGSESGLQKIQAGAWLQAMRDHVDYSGVMPVPDEASWQIVRRVQVLKASDLRRLRKRLMKRTGCTAEEASQRVPDSAAERTRLPYLTIRSTSSGQTFRLFIQQSAVEQRRDGKFNSYGLSHSATVPAFD